MGHVVGESTPFAVRIRSDKVVYILPGKVYESERRVFKDVTADELAPASGLDRAYLFGPDGYSLIRLPNSFA